MAGAGPVARCHCGRATIRLARRPDYVVHCNCSLCTATGFQGIYYASDELEIAGAFDSYVRSDLSETFLSMHRCATCGTGATSPAPGARSRSPWRPARRGSSPCSAKERR